MPVFTPIPEVQPSPEKKKRVVCRPAWKRYQWTCNVQCDSCHYEDDDARSREAASEVQAATGQGSRGSGVATDKLLLLTDADHTCGKSCKFKCAASFPMESRLKVRKLRHDHFSTGSFVVTHLNPCHECMS